VVVAVKAAAAVAAATDFRANANPIAPAQVRSRMTHNRFGFAVVGLVFSRYDYFRPSSARVVFFLTNCGILAIHFT